MKKLLSLLGAIVISGSGVASVAACGDDNDSKTTPAQNWAKEIADEITAFTNKTDNNKVYLMANEILLKNKLTIGQITTKANSDIDAAFFNAAFKSLLLNFDTYDTNHITYTGTLKEGTDNNEITATIKFGAITTTAKFNVVWASEDDYVGNRTAVYQLFNNTQIILPNDIIDPNLTGVFGAGFLTLISLMGNSDNFARNILTVFWRIQFLNITLENIPKGGVVLTKDTNAKIDVGISLDFGTKTTELLPITVRLSNNNQEQANGITSLMLFGNIYSINASIPKEGIDTSVPGPVTEDIKNTILVLPTLNQDQVDNIIFKGILIGKTTAIQKIDLIASIGSGIQEAKSTVEILVMNQGS